MKRSDFLKSLGLGSVGLLLPKGLVQDKPIKVYDNYVKGLHHYQFKKVKEVMKEGDELLLKRDTTNVYDSFAIEVYWNEHKLGYLPAYENIVLANMLDAGVQLHSFISSINPEGFQNLQGLAVEIYAHLVLPGTKLIENNLSSKRADDVVDIYRKGMDY